MNLQHDHNFFKLEVNCEMETSESPNSCTTLYILDCMTAYEQLVYFRSIY